MQKPARTPKHCFHKSTGQGYVRLCGKTFYTGIWGSNKANRLYDQLLAKWLSGGRTLDVFEKTGREYSVGDLIADYWVHANAYYRKNGKPSREIESIKYSVAPLINLYESLSASDFSPSKLKNYREALLDSDLCRKVINQRVSLIKRIFTLGVEEEKIPGETAASIRMVQGLRKGRSKARESIPVIPVSEKNGFAVQQPGQAKLVAPVCLQRLVLLRINIAVACPRFPYK